MRGFINYFIKYPIAANLLMFGLLILGTTSLLSLKTTFFPETPSRIISIQAIYPGASPEEIEEGIVNKIEDNLKGLTGVERYTSVSKENAGTVTVEVLKEYDTDIILQDVKNAVDRVSSFPAGMEPLVIYKQEQLGQAISFAISGESVDLQTLKKTARAIEDDLLAMDGLSKVTLSGFPDEEIEIAFREANLRAYGITFQEAADAVRRTNVDVTGGTIKGESEELLVRARNRDYFAEGLQDIVLKTTPLGGVVRLGQVADVRDQWSDQPNRAYLNGRTSVNINVQNTLEEDLLSITDMVKEYIEEFNATNDVIQATVISDASITLRQRIDTLQENGIMGFCIVVLLLAMFLHWRLAFWVALAIPVSFAGMFILAQMAGITLNVISLFGMIIVIGILVDDGIVIGENIYALHEAGVPPMKAALEGTLQVLPAVFSAILTTVIAFSAFLFIDGRLGDIFAEMALVVIFSLIFSLVEGAVILPTHVAHSKALRPDRTPNRVQRGLENFMNYVRDRLYAPVLRFAINYKFLTLAICLTTLFLTFGSIAGGIVGSTFFPNIEGDDIQVALQMPAGTPEEVTLGYLNNIADAAWRANEELSEEYFNNEKQAIERVDLRLGPTTYQGTLTIALLEGEARDDLRLREAINRVRELAGSMEEAELVSYGAQSPFGKPVNISLVGKNYEELRAATDAVKAELSQLSGLTDVVDNDQEGLREINISLTDKGRFLGLDLQDIVGQVRQGFFGAEAQRLQRGEDEVRVWVRFAEADRRGVADLSKMRIRLPGGEEYPLSEIADLKLQRGVIGINHIDGRREIQVEADIANDDVSVSDVTASIKEDIVPRVLAGYPTVSPLFEGQNREQAKSIASIQYVGTIVLALMFFVIALTFRSIGQAVVLFLIMPFGLIGVAFGHWLMGAPISLFSFLGMIALVGIIVNDGLVFIATYNNYLRDGKDQMDALYRAGLSRFRPIVLTSFTTFAGLAPLLLEKSLQAQFLIPMAISVSFGLLAATVVLLVLLPSLLVMLNRFRIYTTLLWNGHKPAYREVEPAFKELDPETEAPIPVDPEGNPVFGAHRSSDG